MTNSQAISRSVILDLAILSVEDDEGHAILVRENLIAAGWNGRIEHLSDGQAALDFLFAQSEDTSVRGGSMYLVLLDIRMPKVDGIEVLRRLKADAQLRRFPVIMLTTTDDAREVTRCYDLGCNAYVRKPVDYDRFVETIRGIGLFAKLLCVPAAIF